MILGPGMHRFFPGPWPGLYCLWERPNGDHRVHSFQTPRVLSLPPQTLYPIPRLLKSRAAVRDATRPETLVEQSGTLLDRLCSKAGEGCYSDPLCHGMFEAELPSQTCPAEENHTAVDYFPSE